MFLFQVRCKFNSFQTGTPNEIRTRNCQVLPLFKSLRVAYLTEPASRFIFAALTLRILVASVSGNKTTLENERAATMSAILFPPAVSTSPN
jgi:hypothetical protein